MNYQNHLKNNHIKTNERSHHKALKPNRSNHSNPHEIILYGKHAVFGALLAKKRQVFEILAGENSFAELENFLSKNSLQHLKKLTRKVQNQTISNLVGENNSHQNIALRASKLPINTQNDLLEELYSFEENSKLPTLLLLDQITDPQNVGAIIRSAIAFGVQKIIFCEHNSVIENAAIVKSSVGTIEMADLIVVTNLSNLIEKLKKIGYWIIGLAGEATENIDKIAEYKNIALVIGCEGSGIRPLVKKNCDLLAKITTAREVESLNASVAAAIALYEISKL